MEHGTVPHELSVMHLGMVTWAALSFAYTSYSIQGYLGYSNGTMQLYIEQGT